MPATTGTRRLETPEDQGNFKRWRFGFFVLLAFATCVALSAFVQDGRAHKRPVDGYYVTLWRLMLRYPRQEAFEPLREQLRMRARHYFVTPTLEARGAFIASSSKLCRHPSCPQARHPSP